MRAASNGRAGSSSSTRSRNAPRRASIASGEAMRRRRRSRRRSRPARSTSCCASTCSSTCRIPGRWCGGCRGCSGPGGRLILSVPNIRHWKFVWRLIARGDFTYRDAGLLDRTHLRFFVRRTAIELATCGGLELVAATSAQGWRFPEPRWWLARLSGEAGSTRSWRSNGSSWRSNRAEDSCHPEDLARHLSRRERSSRRASAVRVRGYALSGGARRAFCPAAGSLTPAPLPSGEGFVPRAACLTASNKTKLELEETPRTRT